MNYKIALMPTREIVCNDRRTIRALRCRGIEMYGYEKTLAGVIPRICELVSDKQMQRMEFSYIAAPHDPLRDFRGTPRMLVAAHRGGERLLSAYWGSFAHLTNHRWDADGALAFLTSAC